jgi:hypothetical protein
MRTSALLLALAIASAPFGAARAETLDYLVVPHQKGTLALQVAQIRSVWHKAAAGGAASQLRINSPALGEAKLLAGDEADALWKTLHDGAAAERFLFVSHMEGTLGIPRDQLHTAYYAEDAGKPTLRLVYEGDPSGKTLAGDEAAQVWKAIAR